MNPKDQAFLDSITVPDAPMASRQSILNGGDVGTGKTRLLLEAPGPILCIYADNNRMTLDMMKTIRDDIIEIRIEKWSDFDPGVLNLIRNRQLEVETIGVDTIDMLFGILIDRESNNGQKKLGHDEWATVLNTSRRVVHELTQACRPIEGKPSYNIIVNMHLQAQTDSQGNILAYEPAFQGSFRAKISAYFDLVLLADFETKREKVTGTARTELVKRCFLRTVPPSPLYKLKAPIDWPGRIDGGFQEVQRLINSDIKKLTTTEEK